MSQLIQILFNEAVPVGDDVYPEGHRLMLPAEQAFGSHASRQLAPFDLFDSALELVTDLGDGFYRLAYNMDVTIGPRTIRQSDLFHYQLPSSPAFGWFIAIVNPNGSFTLRQSDLSLLATGTVLQPGVDNVVNVQFFYQGTPIAVTGPDLTPGANDSFDLKVAGPMRPGSLQYDVRFTYQGVDYDYPLTLSVLQPGLGIANETPSLKAGEKGLFKFSVLRTTGTSTVTTPDVKIASAALDGGQPGELHSLGNGMWALEVTPKDVVYTMYVRLVLDIEGWKVPWTTYVVITQKAASGTVIDGSVLKINLTQPVRLRIMSDSKLVKTLTTKSLKLSGSPSYHTYSKSLVKVDDGIFQFSVYTNAVQGTMYADIVVTIDGVDLAIPTFPITVRV